MQGGSKSLAVLKNVQTGQENLTLSHVSHVTVDFKKLVSDLYFTLVLLQ